jgi:hypothetical protein
MKLLQAGILGFWTNVEFVQAAINLSGYRAAAFVRQLKDVIAVIKSIYTLACSNPGAQSQRCAGIER